MSKMEVDDSSRLVHLTDQRVPASTGGTAFHDHHDASLDSAYEDNFECGEEAMQRQILITQILSSPLLFCASSSSTNAGVPSKADGSDDDVNPRLRAHSVEIDCKRSFTRNVSNRRAEKIDDRSVIPTKRSTSIDTESTERLQSSNESNCDNDANLSTTDDPLIHISSYAVLNAADVSMQFSSIKSQVASVLRALIDSVDSMESPQRRERCFQQNGENDSDESSESGLLSLSWRPRRPMSGRAESTDSGISSVDDSRLSHSSQSEYASSPATTAGTIDSSDEAQERTLRRSSRLTEAEKFSSSTVITSTARPCAENFRLKTSTAQATISTSAKVHLRKSESNSHLFVKPSAATLIASRKNAVVCQWQNCKFSAKEDNDLADHIADSHVSPQGEQSTFVCLWESCKVFNVPSTLKHWLEQHVVKHSRSKPLKCIVDGCLQRFSTKSLLETHVNSHFDKNYKLKNESSLKNQQQLLKLAKRKRLLRQNSKMQAGRKYDFFDACIMHQIKESLLQFAETEKTSSSTPASPDSSPKSRVGLDSQLPDRNSPACASTSRSQSSRGRRRKFALTDEQLPSNVPSPDSGYSSLSEIDISTNANEPPKLESLVRAYRTTKDGKRQVLISYYRPATESVETTSPVETSLNQFST